MTRFSGAQKPKNTRKQATWMLSGGEAHQSKTTEKLKNTPKKSYYIAFPSREAYSPVPMTCFSWSRSYIIASISWSNELLVAEKLLCAFLASENALCGGFALVRKPEKKHTCSLFSSVFAQIFLREASSGSFFEVILATPRNHYHPKSGFQHFDTNAIFGLRLGAFSGWGAAWRCHFTPLMSATRLCFIQPYNVDRISDRLKSLKLLYGDNANVERLREEDVEGSKS